MNLVELLRRLFAILYVWTVGLVLLTLVMAIGTVFALADVVTPNDPSVTFRVGLRKDIRWFRSLNGYAVFGGWRELDLLPPADYR